MRAPNSNDQPSTPSSDTAHLFLSEVKKRALQHKGKMDYQKLRKEGYSEATIQRLKQIRPAL